MSFQPLRLPIGRSIGGIGNWKGNAKECYS